MRWYTAAILLLTVGLVFRLGLLVYAMYALLGVMLLGRYLARAWIESVAAERTADRVSMEIGETVTVGVTVRNTGRWAIAWLLLEDSVPRDALTQRPPRITVQGRRSAIVRLGGGKAFSVNYRVRFEQRGYYQLGPLLVETGDLFGLHRRYRILTEPRYVLVYPKVLPLAGYDVASRRPIGEVRITHRLFEDPTRIAGVRPYQAGDPLNRIHWRATARTGELHSKVFEPSSVAGATLLLDFHQDGYPARGEPHRSELAVTTAATLANAVYLLGQQFGLFSNGRDAADRIREEGHRHDFRTRTAAQQSAGLSATSDRLRPVEVRTARGPEQFGRVLETLARLELSDGLSFAQLVTEVASRLPRDATVIAILPRVPDETAVALGTLRRGGYAVTAVVLTYSEHSFAESAGRLLAEGIDVRQVDSEAALAALCSQRCVSHRSRWDQAAVVRQ
jgi:uncharacterized protein (DUF58 family)